MKLAMKAVDSQKLSSLFKKKLVWETSYLLERSSGSKTDSLDSE